MEERMNYHSSEDCFLKVEKRFLIMVGHALGHFQIFAPSGKIPSHAESQIPNINCSQLKTGIWEGNRMGYFVV
jgi:hypothetical protein